jgi:hypothetical protein
MSASNFDFLYNVGFDIFCEMRIEKNRHSLGLLETCDLALNCIRCNRLPRKRQRLGCRIVHECFGECNLRRKKLVRRNIRFNRLDQLGCIKKKDSIRVGNA